MRTAWLAFAFLRCIAMKAWPGLLLAAAGLAQEPAPTKARVTGRCLAAETKAPMKGVTVQAGSMWSSFVIRDATGPQRPGAEAPTVTTDAEGRFTVDFEAPTPAALPVTILASMAGRAPWATSRRMVRAGDTIDVGDVELRVGFMVRGKVVDPAGAPVAGEGLLVPGTLGAPNDVLVTIRLSARSDEKGEFTFNAPLPAGTWELVLGNRRHRLQEGGSLKVGADAAPEPLTVVVDVTAGGGGGKALPPAANLTFELTVVEKGTGKPIEAFGVRCHPSLPSAARGMDVRLDGHHEGGRVTVDGVSAAAHVLQVVPKEPGFGRSEQIRVLARDGKIAPVRVELERLHAYAFVVQRGDGTPVSGTTCQLGHVRGRAVDGSTTFMEESQLPMGLPLAGIVPVLIATASSDADGRVVLLGKRDVTDLYIRVSGPGHVATVVPLKPAGDAPQQIVVSVGATIEGTVGPQLPAFWQPKLELRRASVPAQRNPDPNAIGIGKEGRFRFENVEAGEWVVTPVIVLSMQRGTIRRDSRVHLLERRVEVGATGKFEVAIDLNAWQPATIEGIVSQEDAAKVGGVVILVGELGSESWQCGAFAVDDKGRFQAKDLPPGKYRLQWYREAEATHPVVHADAFQLAPGKSVPREFHFGK